MNRHLDLITGQTRYTVEVSEDGVIYSITRGWNNAPRLNGIRALTITASSIKDAREKTPVELKKAQEFSAFVKNFLNRR